MNALKDRPDRKGSSSLPMKAVKPFFPLLLLLAIETALAWDWDTHRFLAEKICDHYSCKCYAEIKEGSIIPDRDFKDFSNHSCYDPSNCSPSSYWSCPYWKSCPAIDKAREWMERATKAQGCERWKYVGIASHYFFDSKCFWHQVTDEDYSNCHKPFEDGVGDKVKVLGLSGWSVCKCGACVSGRDFESWLQEFYAFANGYLQPTPKTTTPQVTPTPTPTTTHTITPTFTPTGSPSMTPTGVKAPGFEIVLALSALAFAIFVRK
jgi:hypothetical protein